MRMWECLGARVCPCVCARTCEHVHVCNCVCFIVCVYEGCFSITWVERALAWHALMLYALISNKKIYLSQEDYQWTINQRGEKGSLSNANQMTKCLPLPYISADNCCSLIFLMFVYGLKKF